MAGGPSTTRRTRAWRERTLDEILRWMSLLGPGIAVGSYLLVSIIHPGRVTSPLYWGMLVPVGGLVLLSRLQWPFRRRARVFIVLSSALALMSVANFGYFPGPILGCMICIIASATMFGLRALVVTWLGISLGVFLAGLPSAVYGIAIIGDPLAHAGMTQWGRAAVSFALFAGPLAAVVHFMVERIGRSESAVLQSRYLQTLGELAGGVAHDFNNSLQLISLWSEILRSDMTVETAAEGLDAIESAVEDARQLTQQLLSLGRRSVFNAQPADLSARVKDWLRTTSRTVPEDIRIVAKIAETPRAKLDPSLLRQVFMNLVLNARDAMPNGGTVHVRLSVTDQPPAGAAPTPAQHWAKLEVEDDGPGMTPAVQARVFEPFFTTKGDGGTGLGLPISHRVAEQHGGQITVDSTPGEGTTFTLYVPLPSATTSPTKPDEIPLQRPSQRQLTILLAEDEQTIRDNLAKVLRNEGHTVFLAKDGTQAMERVVSLSELDVLCTDGVMPGTPTRDVIDRFQLEHPKGHVIICSGHVPAELLRRRLNQREYAFLAKPFSSGDLLREIDQLEFSDVA